MLFQNYRCINNIFEEEKPEKPFNKIEDYGNKILNWMQEHNKDSFETNELRDSLNTIPYASLTLALTKLIKEKKLNQSVRGKYEVVK